MQKKNPSLQMPQVLTRGFSFTGGLDQVTPPIELPNGCLRYSSNVEVGVRGGYTRIAGYERYSGKQRPSTAGYAIIPATITGSVPIGSTLTNDAGTVTATVTAIDSAGIVVSRILGGTFIAGVLRISGIAVATATSPQMANAANTSKLNATYLNLAADVYRAQIAAVPGSGSVLGVHQYKGQVYAFRNNVGGTAAVMHVNSASGWIPVALGRELKFVQRSSVVTITIAAPGVVTWPGHSLATGQKVTFSTTGALPTGIVSGVTYYVTAPAANTFQVAATSGGAAITTTGTQSGTHTAYLTANEIYDGDIITGLISGATATLKRVVLSNGTWATTASGSLIFATNTGTFISNEPISVGGVVTVSSSGGAADITLLPNGRYEFQNHNFGGQASTLRMYGCDGKNRGFEFDGTVFVPITTGMIVDAPKYLRIHKNQLFYAYESSLQHSGIGLPYSWAPIFGAEELAVGDTITGVLGVPGSDGGGAMVVFTQNSTSVLYGNNSDDWKLIKYSDEAGAYPYTMQYVRDGILLDSQGLTTLTTTQRFGNFQNALISDLISPYLSDKITLAAASCQVRRKNQYRVFFSTGEAVYVTYQGAKVLGMTTILMPKSVTCISSMEGATGLEEIYFGSTDGFVYQMDIGTSFDGELIDWSAVMAFNHFGGPRQLKRFRKASIDVSGQGYAEFNFSTSLAYGSIEYSNSGLSMLASGTAGGSTWDSMSWDQFYWDAQSLLPAEADITGTAENISLIFSGSSDEYASFTLNSAVMHFTPQRLLR